MKLKGINPFEQHVEKIVVGTVGLGLLGIVGWQFLSQNTITVGKDQVPISDAYKPVESAAAELQRKSESSNPTMFTAPDLTPLTKFPELFSKPVASTGTLPAMGTVVALGPGGGVGSSGDAMYAAFEAASPTGVVAAQFRGTVAPSERVDIPELLKFLPKEQPFDKAAVSVEANMSGKVLRAMLDADPDGGGPLSALPVDWWLDKVEILAVEVERQEMKTDGSWAASTVLPTIPGREDFMKRWKAEVKDGGAAAVLLPEATKLADEIQRPEYYQMLVGKWVAPSVLAAQQVANFDPNRFATLTEQFITKNADLATKKTELAALPPDDPKKPDPTPSPGGGRDGGGGGGGGKGASPSGPRTPTPDAGKPDETNKQKRARLTRQIGTLDSEIEKIKKEMQDMGGVVPDADRESQTPRNATPAVDANAGKKLLDKGEFKVYAHDITAEPGKSYRYRVRVAMNNPIFGKEILLKKNDAGQTALASDSVAHSGWTDWTPEVSVDRDAYWFITGTNKDALRQNTPSAHAEMYQYYYGYYRKAVATLEPGDPIIGEAKLPKLWLLPEKEVAANPDGGPGAPGRDGGGGKGVGGAGNPAGGNPGQVVPDGPPVPGATPAKEKLVFRDTSSVVMLDVKSAPGVEAMLLAILRSQDGAVVSKSPEADRKSDVYRRVRSSADAGETAAQPKAEPKVNKVRPDEQPQPPDGGGKRGGGGGGGGNHRLSSIWQPRQVYAIVSIILNPLSIATSRDFLIFWKLAEDTRLNILYMPAARVFMVPIRISLSKNQIVHHILSHSMVLPKKQEKC